MEHQQGQVRNGCSCLCTCLCLLEATTWCIPTAVHATGLKEMAVAEQPCTGELRKGQSLSVAVSAKYVLEE